MTTEKLYAQIDNEVIELSGDALSELLALREELAQMEASRQAKLAADKEAKDALLAKLGITDEEAKLLLS